MFENGVENDMRSKLLDVISKMKDEITRCHKYRKKCFNKCVGVAGSEEGVIRASFSEIKNSLKKFESHLEEASNILKPESEATKPQKSDESDREREKSPERTDSSPAEKLSKKPLLEEVAEDSGPEKKVSKVMKRKRPPTPVINAKKSCLDPGIWAFENPTDEFICFHCGTQKDDEESWNRCAENCEKKPVIESSENTTESLLVNDFSPTKTQFQCMNCQTSAFDTEEALKAHMALKHEIKCKHCGQTFQSRGYHQSHMRNDHADIWKKIQEKKKAKKMNATVS